MSDAKPVPVHGKSIPESVKSAKEIISADTVPPKQNRPIFIDMEALTAKDRAFMKKWLDPGALVKQEARNLTNLFTGKTKWAYAFSSTTLFLVPLIQCLYMECVIQNLPTSVGILWHTHTVVILTIITLNLLLAILLSVESANLKFLFILNDTLLAFYYVMGLLLFLAIQPYNDHLAMHVAATSCAVAVTSWILSRAMKKKPKTALKNTADSSCCDCF